MAKRSRNNRPPRDTFRYSLPEVRAVVWPRSWVSPRTLNTPVTRQVLEDRRTWHPERWGRPVLATQRVASRTVIAPQPPGLRYPTARLAFKDPKKVLVCHRRKTRREVLHALGKGGGGNKAPKRKPTSEITC